MTHIGVRFSIGAGTFISLVLLLAILSQAKVVYDLPKLGNLTKQYEWRPKSTKLDEDGFRCIKHWREFREKWNSGADCR